MNNDIFFFYIVVNFTLLFLDFIKKKPHQRRKYILYGSDIEGTFMDSSAGAWNLNDLKTVLKCVTEKTKEEMNGITKPYLYYGTCMSSFAWHTEDIDLFSINYHHYGKPKFWYSVGARESRKLERKLKESLPEELKKCKLFQRHKYLLLTPEWLDEHNIKYSKVKTISFVEC